MSRFHKLSHAIWHCQYHLVWVPKYRYRILKGAVGQEVSTCIHVFAQQKECEVVELNVQVESRSPACACSAEGVYLRIGRHAEGSQCHSCFQAVSLSEGEALLGESFLGARLLCGYGGSGC